jgi:hypothetical protein
MNALRSEASEWKCDDNTKAKGKETGSKKSLRIVKDWRKFALLLGITFPFL